MSRDEEQWSLISRFMEFVGAAYDGYDSDTGEFYVGDKDDPERILTVRDAFSVFVKQDS